MIVNVYTFKDGRQTINEVTAIRIKSKDYNLLILKDYLAIVGEIEGDIVSASLVRSINRLVLLLISVRRRS